MGKTAKQIAEERRRREQELSEKLLTAAGDGDYDTVEELLSSGFSPECQGPGEYSPLSEAANQGNMEIVKLLLQYEADPNSQGEYKRTPLWRAAFNDHDEVCKILLQAGADPQVPCQNQRPSEVCSAATRSAVFNKWDISETERLQMMAEAKQESRRIHEQHTRLMELSTHTGLSELQELEKQRREAVRLLEMARDTYNRYAAEYDHMCTPTYTGNVTQGMLDAALVAVSSAEQRFKAMEDSVRFIEGRIIQARGAERHTRSKEVVLQWDPTVHHRCGPGFQRVVVFLLMLNSRQEQLSWAGLHSYWAWMADDLLFYILGYLPHVRVDLLISLEEVEEVVIHDADHMLCNSARWPLLIDTTGRAAMLLRYRNTVFIDAFRPQALEEDTIRHALLGSLQFGRCIVVSIGDLDVLYGVAMAFDKVQKGLLDIIMDKSILHHQFIARLIRPEDRDVYPMATFNDTGLQSFRFVLITTCRQPCLSIQDQVFVIAVSDQCSIHNSTSKQPSPSSLRNHHGIHC